MKTVFYENKQYDLTEADFIATGGEGAVYRLSQKLVAKLLHNPKKWRASGGEKKIRKLAAFSHPTAATPTGILFASAANAKPVGFVSPYVEGEAMARFYTSAFWKRTGFAVNDAMRVAGKLRTLYEEIHEKGWLLIDPNEYNILMSVRAPFLPTVIDTDSWYVGGETDNLVQMPSIIDYSGKKLGVESDWYAYAVTTFQLFTGIHPFRGSVSGYKKGDIKTRAKKRVSVFRPEVRVPSAVRPLNNIPSRLRRWYEDVFEHGARTAPPENFGVVQQASLRAINARVQSSGSVVVLERVMDHVQRVYPGGYVLTDTGEIYTVEGDMCAAGVGNPRIVVPAPKGILLAHVEGALHWYISGAMRDVSLPQHDGVEWVSFDGNLFLPSYGHLQRVSPIILGGKPFVKREAVLSYPKNATQWFEGVGIAELFGKRFVFGLLGNSSPVSWAVPELANVSIIGARGFRHSVLLVYERSGMLFRAWLAPAASGYSFTEEEVDIPSVTGAEHPNGFVVEIPRDGELSLHHIRTGDTRILSHNLFRTDGEVVVSRGKTFLYVDGALYRVRTR